MGWMWFRIHLVCYRRRNFSVCQIQPSHSISAGLDYPGVGPEHAYLAETGRVHYGVICDASALNAFRTLTREEGIIPALESSHAVAWVLDHAEELPQGGDVLVNLSGRGDKDVAAIARYKGVEIYE